MRRLRMFCHHCGKEIDDNAVVCVHCGVETKNLTKEKDKDKSINIVNQSSSTSQATLKGMPRVYNGAVDFLMILLTGGLWIFWMIFRPKYY